MEWESWLSESAKNAKASDIRELLKLTARPNVISLAGGLPDPTLFPVAEYKVALTRVMDTYGPKALQYSTTEGLDELRLLLLKQLESENITCPLGIENLLLTTGSQQALDLLGRLLINPGDTVLVEAPSYLGALQAFSTQQPRYEAIEMDGEGLLIDQLEFRLGELKRAGRFPKFLYTVPTFQNPAGVTLSLERRQALLKLAQRENLLIIEDDPYSRLRFRGETLPSLQSLDTTGRVITLRTFSKTLAPGLRTGYVIGDAEILRKLAILKQAADLCSPALAQYTVLEMLKMNAMEPYIQKVVGIYRQKEELMAQVLRSQLSACGMTCNEPDGGMFFWLQLPAGTDTGELLSAAIEAGVAYVKGAAFYTDAISGHNCLRLNFSQPSPAQIEQGVGRLARLIEARTLVGV